VILSLHDVVGVTTQSMTCAEPGSQVVFMRVLRTNKRNRYFFIDFDDNQSNIREVHRDLNDLSAVLNWLLPAGYSHRQGDIGIYARQHLPLDRREIPNERQSTEFAGLMNRRHRFDCMQDCKFFRKDNRYFVQVLCRAHMVHPEHPSIALNPGLYELRGAKGRVVGRTVAVRSGKPPFVEL